MNHGKISRPDSKKKEKTVEVNNKAVAEHQHLSTWHNHGKYRSARLQRGSV